MIYKRFTEKSAEEWRQIYKALQLMEFLIKNGSERVIDDARSHLSLLKMLRQFHYIDENGKDQGVNVRNRSKELTDLLSDVERIRSERKKARATRNKYGGVEGGTGLGFGPGSGSSRYGGFGSETGGAPPTFGGATRGVYGDGGGFGGESHDNYNESGTRGGADRFDDYDEYDDGGAQATRRSKPDVQAKRTSKKLEPAKPKEPEVDLFDFGDEPSTTSNGGAASSSADILSSPTSAPAGAGDDDDFDDFQDAPPPGASSSAAFAAPLAPPAIPKPNYSSISSMPTIGLAGPTSPPATQKPNFSNLFPSASPLSGTGTPSKPVMQSPPQQNQSGYQPTGPNYFTSVQVQQNQQQSFSNPGSGVTSPTGGFGAGGQPAKKAGGGDVFANLLSGSGIKKPAPKTQGLTIADMAKQKSQAGLYGANAPAQMAAPANSSLGANMTSTGSSGLDDLLG